MTKNRTIKLSTRRKVFIIGLAIILLFIVSTIILFFLILKDTLSINVNADSILPLFTGLNLPVFVFGIIQN